MKLLKYITLYTLIASAFYLVGCGTERHQVMRKDTVFGLQAQTPAPYQITIQVGLIRSFDLVNPVSSNGVAASFHSFTDANLTPFKQVAKETVDTK